MENNIKQYLNSLNINITDEQLIKLSFLCELTLKKNEVMNLTAITDKDEFMIKMIVDSLLPLSCFSFNKGSAIDIGTGAGFPGLPLAVLLPNINFTLLDSTSKKIEHVKQTAKELGLNIKNSCLRAESFAKNNREQYDYAFARAVAPLNILLEIIIPLLKVDGYFFALKGPSVEQEILDSKIALKKLDCSLIEVKKFNLPNDMGERNIVIIKKNKITNKKYPRDYADIKNKSL